MSTILLQRAEKVLVRIGQLIPDFGHKNLFSSFNRSTYFALFLPEDDLRSKSSTYQSDRAFDDLQNNDIEIGRPNFGKLLKGKMLLHHYKELPILKP